MSDGTTIQGRGVLASAALSALALVIAACGYPKPAAAPPPLPPAAVASAQAKWPDVTEETLTTGRSLFVTRCKACHAYPDLTVIDEARWPAILAKMGPRAGVSGKDLDALTRFVIAAHDTPAPPLD